MWAITRGTRYDQLSKSKELFWIIYTHARAYIHTYTHTHTHTHTHTLSLSLSLSLSLFRDSINYLGLTIVFEVLSHGISRTTSRVYASLHRLKLCRHLLPFCLRQRVISSFYLFNYCCTTLTDITSEQNLWLHRSLNACIRFIFQVRRDKHITPYYRKLNWLKIAITSSPIFYWQPIIYYPPFQEASYLWKSRILTWKNALPKTILCCLCFNAKSSSLSVQMSFKCYAIELRNSIPSDIRQAILLEVFKSKYFHF